MISYKEVVSLMENLQDMVFVMEYRQGYFTYSFVNSIALKYIGNPIDIIGKKFNEVLGKDEAEQVQSRYLEVVKTKNHYTYQDSVIINENEKVYTETLLSPIFNEHKDVIAVVAITRDMTERYLERQNMIESEQRYKSLYEQNLDAIFTLDSNGNIMNMNYAGANILGYENEALMGTSIFDLIDINSIKAFYSVISPTLAGKASESLNCELIHQEGYNLLVHFKTVPILIHEEVVGIYLIVRDVSKQAESERRIKFLAYHDDLTGLYNRKALTEHISRCIMKYQLRKSEFALLVIDLDRFKVINDVLGHQLGDYVIEEFASRLKRTVSKGISIFRMGGDEFGILIEPCDQRRVSALAIELLQTFKQPLSLNDNEYYMSATIGISMYPSDGEDTETLIKNATVALHRGKDNSRGSFQFYNSNLHYLSPRTMGIETNLRKSIKKKELIIHYQPQVKISSGKVCGVEALIRWKSEEYGLVSPAEFIPIAEETGFILEIGEWIIYEVCAQLKKWKDSGYEMIPISINLSPKQFLSATLFETVQDALIKNKIHPSYLTIEITENAMMDPLRTIKILNQLKDIGIRISIDDFGTGYSSLSYLKKFPIDILKIDQSFVKEITAPDGKDAAITASLIQLAKLLQLDIVAEGVETKEQVEFLQSKNCTYVQGYYYSKPLDIHIFEEIYLKR